jgi:hypothetical protein
LGRTVVLEEVPKPSDWSLRRPVINGTFVDVTGISVIHDRAISAEAQEHLIGGDVSTDRTSLGTLGSGFVEAITDETFLAIQSGKPPSMRVGRFGWKSQHAPLDFFSADALSLHALDKTSTTR